MLFFSLSRQFSTNAQASYAAAAAPRPSSPILIPPTTPTGTGSSGLAQDSARHSSSTPPITYAAIAGKTAPETATPPESSSPGESQRSLMNPVEMVKEEKIEIQPLGAEEFNNLGNYPVDLLRDVVSINHKSTNASQEPQSVSFCKLLFGVYKIILLF